ncbi:MAG TPA: IS1595 family transposase [Burkholderiales bacterium]|nr:IS1595 family transposase [Burkholderiales bacterium]
MATPKFTFAQFKAQYPDDDACLEAIMKRRFGDRPTCPGCGVIGTTFHKITGRRGYACAQCGHHVFPCAGTVFEHSSTPLSVWFHCMYLMTATRNGVSAKEIQRQTGVTYKCAWRIGHQLRDLMSARAKAQNPGPLSRHVELDETYVGGKIRHFKGHGKGEYLKNKATVFGMVERNGGLRAKVVPNELSSTLLPIVQANVAKKTTISTDMHRSYRPLWRMGYKHSRVNHDINEWVRGNVHTNTIEGFWSHLKRGIKSTHASVSKKHLQRYVDEFAFRYNNREAPADMFQRMLKQLSTPSKGL